MEMDGSSGKSGPIAMVTITCGRTKAGKEWAAMGRLDPRDRL